MRRKLRGRTVLLTGASRGIGRLVAERLAHRGAKLALVARSGDALRELVDQFSRLGVDALALPADLTVPAERERVVGAVVERFGGLDVLINNAGVASFGEFETSSEEILRRIMAINFFAPADLIRLSIPHLAKSATLGEKIGWRPAILNVTSICGRRGLPSFTEHCASKFALSGLSEALIGELARFDIDVLMVIPGLTRPDDVGKHLLRNEGRLNISFAAAKDNPDAVAEAVLDGLTRNRRETVVGRLAWWIWIGQRLGPRILTWLIKKNVEGYERRQANLRRLGRG